MNNVVRKATYKTGYFCTHEDHDSNVFVGEFYKDWKEHWAHEHGNRRSKEPSEDSIKQAIADALQKAQLSRGLSTPYEAAKIAYGVIRGYLDEPTTEERNQIKRSINLYDEFYANTGWKYTRLEKELKHLDDTLEGEDAVDLRLSRSQIHSIVLREFLKMVMPRLHTGAVYRGHNK